MKSMIESLVARLQDLVDDDDTPEANCSCHVSPPCTDCLDYAHRRELIEAAKRTLAQANEEMPMLAELALHLDGINPDGSSVGRSLKTYGYIDDLVAIKNRCEMTFAPDERTLRSWFASWWDDDARYRPIVGSAKEMCWEAVKAMSINMPHPVTGEVDVVRIHERVAASFWAQLGFGATIDEAAVKRELTDYHFLLEQLPRIYMHVTGGLLSKTNYLAETVIVAHDDHVSGLIQEQVLDSMVSIFERVLKGIDELELDEAMVEAASEALGSVYECRRVWSAWAHGTMSSGDFSLVADDGDRVAEIVKAIIKSWVTSTIETLKEKQDEQG